MEAAGQEMTDFISTIGAPLGAGVAVGFLIGYAVKKIVKLLMILVGGYLAGMLYLQSIGWFTPNWAKITADTQGLANRLVSAETTNNVYAALGNIGMPLSAGLTGGLIWGFSKG